uniref:Farnesylated proteins-converting enzyme 2 n=1 Tax=Panagrolaimus sp. JU765 TaxID=591449 RepID=A0AC34Q5Q4_9BILA
MVLQNIAYFAVAVAIPGFYVGSLYYVEHKLRSNHPQALRKRFRAVSIISAASVVVTYILLKLNNDDPLDKMGFHLYGTIASAVFPLFLTSIFYSGTLVTCYLDGSLELLFSVKEWRRSFNNIQWVRYIIVGPLTEEIAFRSCGAVLILQCFPAWVAYLVYPLFFSVCHMHHLREDLHDGLSLKSALTYRLFQCSYTYLFGVYATYLFVQTGHILSPILVHAFCNSLGIPNVEEASQYPVRTRRLLWVAHISGFIGWALAFPYLLYAPLYNFI